MENQLPHVPAILKSRMREIHTLCQKHHVAKLWVFGSVFSSHFTKSSDIDFLYEWDEQAISAEYFLNNMWDLLDSLEALFGHTIDWIYAKNLQNPYFIEEIEETKVLLYDQESEKVSI
ncbi:MAG: nucleotidyltransferase domain-containing protein [Bacteroidota bacterium]